MLTWIMSQFWTICTHIIKLGWEIFTDLYLIISRLHILTEFLVIIVDIYTYLFHWLVIFTFSLLFSMDQQVL